MKKITIPIISFFLILTFFLSLAGCDGQTTVTPTPLTTSPAVSTPLMTSPTVSLPPITITGDFFEYIANNAEKYNGKTVKFTAYYFSTFEFSGLCEKLVPDDSHPGALKPQGPAIWTWGLPKEAADNLYKQDYSNTGYPSYLGKLEVTGVFESNGNYGHMNAYDYQITIAEAKLLDWKPGEE